MSRLGRVLALQVACALGSGVALAASDTVEVAGFAAVIEDDVAAARDRALDDARRKAVEQVAGAKVSSETITSNFELVEDRIYARASGFVKKYKVLDEAREGDTYQVRIEAEVDGDSLVERLDQLFSTKPRVIVLVAEQNIGSDEPRYWWGSSGASADLGLMQSSLMQAWQPRGYTFVDPGMLAGELKVEGPMKSAELSNQAAVSIGKDTDADIAVVGKVLVNDAGPMMEGVKMHAFHAVGTLRVLSLDTAEILAVVDSTGVAGHVNPNLGGRLAIKDLAKKAGAELEEKLLARWMADAASSREIQLELVGVRGGKELRAIETGLREKVRGVESVRTRRRKGEVARLTVQVRARAQDFAREVESERFGAVGLEPTDVSRNRVVATVTRGAK